MLYSIFRSITVDYILQLIQAPHTIATISRFNIFQKAVIFHQRIYLQAMSFQYSNLRLGMASLPQLSNLTGVLPISGFR